MRWKIKDFSTDLFKILIVSKNINQVSNGQNNNPIKIPKNKQYGCTGNEKWKTDV